MTDNPFIQDEYLLLKERYKGKAIIEEVIFQCERKSFFDKIKSGVETNRRGEAVFCVVRPDGVIITITCNEYPKGTFRIPTGGLMYNESPEECVIRETKEELGLNVDISEFAGILKINLCYEKETVKFYSYLFILREISGNLLEDATDQEVSEVKLVSLSELEDIADDLKNMQGIWSDWGKFRYLTTRAVFDYLK